MLDETKAKIKNAFSVLCPEIEATDEQIEFYIELIEPMLDERKFGKLYVTAFVYLMAHHIVMRTQIDLADGGTGTGSSNQSIISNIVSEKEGDLQRSYGNGVANASSGDSGADLLDKTYYGLEFKRIRAMCIIPVVTRLDLMI